VKGPQTQIDQQPVTQITIIEAESERQTEALSLMRKRAHFTQGYLQAIDDGLAYARALHQAAFRFLLDREPKESILGHFDIAVISGYFHEFESELPRYLSES